MLKLLGKIPFWMKTLVAFAAGVAVALCWGKDAVAVFDPIGNTYIRAIKMLVAPLVFFTIAASIARLGHGEGDHENGSGGRALRLGAYTIGWFMITSAIAVSVGLAIGIYFQPGHGVGVLPVDPSPIKAVPGPVEVLTGIVPSNIFQSFAEGKVLSIVVFAILVGAALGALGQKTRELSTLIDQGSQVMFKLTRWIIQLTPIGVFGLIGSVVASYGLEALKPLIPYIGLIYLGCLIEIFIVYPTLLKIHGLRVRGFYKGIFTAQQTAFFTCSSIGTLPVSLQVAVDNLKLPKSFAGFALPLGANMKMDGCGAIYPAISSIFIANYFGIHLTPTHYVIIALSSILGSLATAGVPGVATVMLTVTLSAAGLPLEGLAILAAIDRILDMMRTATNVTSQILVATLVARENGLIETGSPLLNSPKKLSPSTSG
ncbi:dicarboxylate/amino acid:cation symporter [Asticcacaulis solisilvae]|uniref:dicarboxylate/amino acid:cation symporter n=1 Tax=Asticcacaulis solisilvae TaxID=1217274 RepID=UPI003FD6CD05